MAAIKPFELKTKVGIVGTLVLVSTVLGFLIKWKDFYAFLVPGGIWLNWRFVIALIGIAALIVWFVMNELWRREYEAHQKTRFEGANLRDLLNISENERKTDVITGIPNGSRLTDDLQYFATQKGHGQLQIILIDIRNFRSINKRFGFLKGDELLRLIAQDIYRVMRKNEEMYKHPGLRSEPRSIWRNLYRRYPGGDEFVFLVEGDQADALGFVVNRLVPQFGALSQRTKPILGEQFELSFQCAIAPLNHGDSVQDVFERIEDCYMRAAEGTAPFTICWHPAHFEEKLEAGNFKKTFYEKARKQFEVLSIR